MSTFQISSLDVVVQALEGIGYFGIGIGLFVLAMIAKTMTAEGEKK